MLTITANTETFEKSTINSSSMLSKHKSPSKSLDKDSGKHKPPHNSNDDGDDNREEGEASDQDEGKLVPR